ncbi:MAG: hypothetical protein E7629_05785 [Ruminococcaceae bacterium]|nr:hypothetical protein [Oscillospiraceae bacterium]
MRSRLAAARRFFIKHWILRKTNCENFDQTFLKVCAVEAAEASSTPAGVEMSFLAFFFLLTFSFAPIWSKEKVANNFVLFNEPLFL